MKHGKPFILLTDHKPLIYWRTSKQMDGPLWRWYTDLSTYDFEVVHIQGSKNISDCPSRLPRTDDDLFKVYLQAINKQGKIRKISLAAELQGNGLTVSKQVNTDNAEVEQAVNTVESNLHATITNTCSQEALDSCTQPNQLDLAERPIEKWEIQFLDKETLIQAQKDDPVLSVVRRWVETDTKPPLSNKIQKLSTELKNYRSSFTRLKMKDGVLFRTWERENLEFPDDLVCIPEYYQETIIRLAHDIPTSGHFGQFKTLNRIRSRFYFPHCELMVKLHIDNCNTCILKSGKRKPVAPLQPFYGSHPNDIVQMDLCGPFPRNKHGFEYVLVILCKFSGWTEVVPMKQTTSAQVARVLLDSWISRNGLMNQLHSDRGPQFCSEDLKAVFKMLGLVYQSQTTSYNPKCDGGAEKLVSVVKRLLASYCRENPEVWPEMLQQLIFAHRTSISATTKYSPMFLHTGRSAKLPMDLVFGTYTQKRYGTQGEYAYDLYKKLRKVYKHVEDNLKASRDMAKQYYDNRTNVKQYKVGDFVYLWRPKKKGSNAFTSNFYGPFEIKKLCGDYNYKLDVGKSRIHNVVPHDLLRLAPQRVFSETRDFDPIDVELDHILKVKPPNTGPTEDHGNTPEGTDDQPERPVIVVDNNPQGFVQGRPARMRRAPNWYQAGFN